MRGYAMTMAMACGKSGAIPVKVQARRSLLWSNCGVYNAYRHLDVATDEAVVTANHGSSTVRSKCLAHFRQQFEGA